MNFASSYAVLGACLLKLAAAVDALTKCRSPRYRFAIFLYLFMFSFYVFCLRCLPLRCLTYTYLPSNIEGLYAFKCALE
jgi:hypothetical protein